MHYDKWMSVERDLPMITKPQKITLHKYCISIHQFIGHGLGLNGRKKRENLLSLGNNIPNDKKIYLYVLFYNK